MPKKAPVQEVWEKLKQQPKYLDADSLEQLWQESLPPDLADYAQSVGSGVLRGVAGIPAGIADFGAAVQSVTTGGDVRDTALHKGAEAIRGAAESVIPREPKLAGSFMFETVPEAVGSMVGFGVAGKALGAAGKAAGLSARAAQTAGIASAGAAVGGADQYMEALEMGASPEDRWKALAGGAAVGATEIIPIGRMLNRLNSRTGGLLRNALVEFSEEFLQESGQTYLTNTIARELYDEERDLMAGALESGSAGGLAALFLSVLISRRGIDANRGLIPPPLDESVYSLGSEEAPASKGLIESRRGIDANIPPPLAESVYSPGSEEAPASKGLIEPELASEPTQEVVPSEEGRPLSEGSEEIPAPEPEPAAPAPEEVETAQRAFVRGQIEAGIQPEAITNLEVAAEETLTPAQQADKARAAEYGVSVEYVRSGDTPLPRPAMYQDRVIVMDANLADDERREGILNHELWHFVEEVAGADAASLHAAFAAADPEGMQAAREAYAAARPGISERQARSEGMGRYIEELRHYSKMLRSDPAVVQRLAEGSPGLLQRIVDGVAALLNRIPGVEIKTVGARLEAAMAAFTPTKAEERLGPEKAAAAAIRLQEAYDAALTAAEKARAAAPSDNVPRGTPVAAEGSGEAETPVQGEQAPAPAAVEPSTRRAPAARPEAATSPGRPRAGPISEAQKVSGTKAKDLATVEAFLAGHEGANTARDKKTLTRVVTMDGKEAPREEHIRRLVGEGFQVETVGGKKRLARGADHFTAQEVTQAGLRYAEYLGRLPRAEQAWPPPELARFRKEREAAEEPAEEAAAEEGPSTTELVEIARDLDLPAGRVARASTKKIVEEMRRRGASEEEIRAAGPSIAAFTSGLQDGSISILPARDEGLPFAVEGPELDFDRVQELEQRAYREGESTAIGSKPYKRAIYSADAKMRASHRAIDEHHREMGKPVHISNDEQAARAEDALAADYEGVKERIGDKMMQGVLLSPWERHAATMIATRMALSGAPGREALAWISALRQNTADIARALQTIRDPLKVINYVNEGLSPADRLAALLNEMAADIEERIQELKKEYAEPDTGVERRREIREEINKLADEDGRRRDKAIRNLRKAGVPLELITSEWFTDIRLWGRLLEIIGPAKSSKTDMFIEYGKGGLVTGWLSSKANIFGTGLNTFYETIATHTAEAIVNTAVRDPQSASIRELIPFWKGIAHTIGPAFRNMARTFTSGVSAFEFDLQTRGVDVSGPSNKFDIRRGGAIPGLYGKIHRRAGYGLLSAQDDFFKTIAAGAHLNILAWRKAMNEGLDPGTQEFRDRMEEMKANPREMLWEHEVVAEDKTAARASGIKGLKDAPTLLGAALKKGRVATFHMIQGPIANAALKLAYSTRKLFDYVGRRWMLGYPLGQMVFPFVRFGVGGTAIAMDATFGPMTQFVRALKGDYGRPGPKGKAINKKRLVEDSARTLISAAITWAVLEWVFDDDGDDMPLITGSRPQSYEESSLMWATVPPYRVKIPFLGYVDYQRWDPFSTQLAMTVDAAREVKEAMTRGDSTSETIGNALRRLFSSVYEQLDDKVYLRQVGEIQQAMESFARKDKSSKTAGIKMARNLFVMPLVPNLIPQWMREEDQYIRQTRLQKYDDQTALESAAKSVPYQTFPTSALAPVPRYDMLGRPITRFNSHDVGRIFGSAYLYKVLAPLPTDRKAAKDVPEIYRMVLRYNDKVLAGEIPESDERWYPKAPQFWFQRGGKTYYFTDDEYAFLTREGGQLGAARITATEGINWEDPGHAEIEYVDKTMKAAWKEAREYLISLRMAGEPAPKVLEK